MSRFNSAGRHRTPAAPRTLAPMLPGERLFWSVVVAVLLVTGAAVLLWHESPDRHASQPLEPVQPAAQAAQGGIHYFVLPQDLQDAQEACQLERWPSNYPAPVFRPLAAMGPWWEGLSAGQRDTWSAIGDRCEDLHPRPGAGTWDVSQLEEVSAAEFARRVGL